MFYTNIFGYSFVSNSLIQIYSDMAYLDCNQMENMIYIDAHLSIGIVFCCIGLLLKA